MTNKMIAYIIIKHHEDMDSIFHCSGSARLHFWLHQIQLSHYFFGLAQHHCTQLNEEN